MNTIREYILSIFGLSLTDTELQKILDWYEKEGKNISREKFFGELQGAIVTLFPGRKIKLFEEDTSDVTVILAALEKAIQK